MVRIYKKGRFYHVDLRRWGMGRPSLGVQSLKAAQVRFRHLELEYAEGKKPRVWDISFTRVVVHYLRRCKVRNADQTIYNKKIYARRFINHFHGPITKITRTDVERYLDYRKGIGAGAPTLNRELAVLRHLFNFAIEWGKLEKNPAGGVKFLKEVRKPLNLPTPGEIKKWLDWCEKNDTLLHDLSVVALNTGLRKGDILKIEGKDIDAERRMLRVSVGKTRAAQYIPLNKAAFKVLQQRQIDGSIFPADFKRRFKTAKRETGLEFRFHDFRHLFATATISKTDTRTVQGLLGHAKITTTERYLALLDERQRQAVEELRWR